MKNIKNLIKQKTIMKALTLVSVVILLITIINLSSTNNNFGNHIIVDAANSQFEPAQRSNRVIQKSLSVDTTFSSSEDYGVTTDGIFFFKATLEPEVDSMILVIVPENPIYIAECTIRENNLFNNHRYYKMIRVGDYYLAKVENLYANPIYYFSAGYTYYPTFDIDQNTFDESILSSNDLLSNECGGYLLKSNQN